MTELSSIAPEAALDLYLEQRKGELSDETLRSHRSRLSWFIEWCEDEAEIYDMTEVTGRDLHSYRVWRREEGDLEPISLKTQLSTLRVFLDFCESIDAVPDDLKQKVLLPEVSRDGEKSDSTLEYERADRILDYLEKYEYASREHVCISLLWRTGMRQGSLRALDLRDYDRKARALEVRHRPETDTPLKNQERGERDVALDTSLTQLLDDYISGRRKDLTDEHGRAPLLTTSQGRPANATIRQTVYKYTRPCFIGEGCPHGREIEECEAIAYDVASKCPSSRSPHRIRTGAVTWMLNAGIPPEVVAQRVNASVQTIRDHYDWATESQRWSRYHDQMDSRREHLQKLDFDDELDFTTQ